MPRIISCYHNYIGSNVLWYLYFKIIFTLITTITQQSSIKTEQFIDVQKDFFLFCRCRSSFRSYYGGMKIGKTNNESFPPRKHADVLIQAKISCSRRKTFALTARTTRHSLIFTKLSGTSRSSLELRTSDQSLSTDLQDGEGFRSWCALSFYYLFDFSFYHFMFQDMSFSYFTLVHKKIEFLFLCLPWTSVKREKIARWTGFFFHGSTERRKKTCAMQEKNFSLFSLCSTRYVPSALMYRHRHRHAVKVEKLFFNELQEAKKIRRHLPTDSVVCRKNCMIIYIIHETHGWLHFLAERLWNHMF